MVAASTTTTHRRQNEFRRALKPDAQAFDEVRFVTVPRYKQSGLSGDEWRVSVQVQFWRNGAMVHSDIAAGDMEKAMALAAWRYEDAIGNGYGMFAGESTTCDQEGCGEAATVVYRLKQQYCREGHATEPLWPTIRMFCDRHKRRGDCGLEDADANYERLDLAPENVESAR